MRKRLFFFVVAMLMCLGLSLHARAGKGGTPKNVPNFLARADFHDQVGDAIRSDGEFTSLCGNYDYIDNQDTCDPNDVVTASFLGKDATYFLRPFPGDLSGEPRWLVLNFGTDAGNPPCPDLDTALSNYPGRYTGVAVPPVTSGCIDNVAVRFFANQAFQAGAQTTSVYLLIDGPDQEVWGLQWNAKYRLEFVNPLSVVAVDADTITVATVSDAPAQLWSLSKTGRKVTPPMGIFNMPFQVTVKKTSQVFVP
jgi:hypothetical protein